METSYNRIAGQNLERVAALSDGLFAIALTILVLVQLNYAIAPRIRPLSRL